jgi:hypothetical protein
LILPFAYLFTVARDMTLDLLEQMQVSAEPGVTKNALEVVIKAWCDEAVDTIQGTYSIKVKCVFDRRRPLLVLTYKCSQ